MIPSSNYQGLLKEIENTKLTDIGISVDNL